MLGRDGLVRDPPKAPDLEDPPRLGRRTVLVRDGLTLGRLLDRLPNPPIRDPAFGRRVAEPRATLGVRLELAAGRSTTPARLGSDADGRPTEIVRVGGTRDTVPVRVEGTRVTAPVRVAGTRVTAPVRVGGTRVAAAVRVGGTRVTAPVRVGGTRVTAPVRVGGIRVTVPVRLAGARLTAGVLVGVRFAVGILRVGTTPRAVGLETGRATVGRRGTPRCTGTPRYPR
jgi:hypothetical protein